MDERMKEWKNERLLLLKGERMKGWDYYRIECERIKMKGRWLLKDWRMKGRWLWKDWRMKGWKVDEY